MFKSVEVDPLIRNRWNPDWSNSSLLLLVIGSTNFNLNTAAAGEEPFISEEDTSNGYCIKWWRLFVQWKWCCCCIGQLHLQVVAALEPARCRGWQANFVGKQFGQTPLLSSLQSVSSNSKREPNGWHYEFRKCPWWESFKMTKLCDSHHQAVSHCSTWFNWWQLVTLVTLVT